MKEVTCVRQLFFLLSGSECVEMKIYGLLNILLTMIFTMSSDEL